MLDALNVLAFTHWCREAHRAVFAALREGFLKRHFVLHPAVGDQESQYRRVVDS